MNWAESIDLYCERTDPGLWSEPVNALSNFGFFVVAALLWGQAGNPSAPGIRVLISLIAAVGMGSLSFHTLATRGTAVLDIAFIGLFVLAYFQCFQRRVLERRAMAAWRNTLLFLLLAGLFALATRALPSLPLNGSEIYLPPFALLLHCAWRSRGTPASRWLAGASGLFVLSLACRGIDQLTCPIWPLGTHAGWHLVNAAVLYACMRGLMLTPPVPAPPSTAR